MTRHTPGPWTADHNGVISDASGHGIAEIWKDSFTERSKSEEEANACVIAAAPDLLAALEGIVPQILPYIDTEEDEEIALRLMAWVETARAAVAKAKSREGAP